MAKLLKGAPAAKALCEKVSALSGKLRESGIEPTLALVRVGENDADIYYERNAIKRCNSVGVSTRSVVLTENVTEEEFLREIDKLNRDEKVHGILIFRPLPKHISDKKVSDLLAPEKDVDGITEGSLAGIFTGSGRGFCPCTAEACLEILDYYGIELTGKRVCVVGRSLVIGKPVSQLMLGRNATVTVCHTKTQDMAEETRRADIIIAAAGHMGTIGEGNVVSGQVIIDVGINTDADGKMCGDVEFEKVEPVVEAVTPVPGGVGSVTTSILAYHVVKAAERVTGNV